MKTFVQILLYGCLVVLVVGIIAVIYKYTNGFNEDFKTFYVEHNGEQILTENTAIELDPEQQHVFTVKYTFDKDEDKRGYTVKVLANATADFEFTIGNKAYTYSKAKELTDAFKIIKDESSFEIEVDESENIQEVLKQVYGDTVYVPKAQADRNEYPFVLVVSSYNGNVNYKIAFKIKGVSEIEELTRPTPDEPIEPNEPPTYNDVADIKIPVQIVFTGGSE